MSNQTRNIGVVVVIIAIVAVASFAFILLQPPVETENNWAFITPGSITDSGWNAQVYLSAQKFEDITGYNVRIVYGVGQAGADALYLELIDQGYDIIYGATFNYMDVANNLAPTHTDITFIGPNWYSRQYPNVVAHSDPLWQGAYLCGMYAGGLTQTGKIGMISGFRYAQAVAQANTFYLGANMTYNARTGSDVNMSVIYAGVWDDVDKGREAGEAMISASVDVVMGRGNGLTLGAIQAFSGVNDTYFIGDVADQYALASDTVVVSNVLNFTVTFLGFDTLIKAGPMTNETFYVFGITEEEVQVMVNPNFSDAALNANLANLTTWIASVTTALIENTTQLPFLDEEIFL